MAPLGRRAALSLPLGMAAAGAGAQAPSRAVQFFVWTAVEPLLRSTLAGFEAAQHQRLRLMHVPWAAYRDALAARLMGGAEMDVCAMADLWLPEFAERGWLAPLDSLPGATGAAGGIRPACTGGMSWRGRTYGVPYYTDSIVFLCNRALLDRAGIAAPPESWEEVVAQSLLLQRSGLVRHALALPLAPDPWQIEVLTALVYAFGGSLVDASLDPVMQDDTAGAVPALRFLVDALHRHAILPPQAPTLSETDVLDAMADGEHAFCLAPSYRLRTLNDAALSSVAGRIQVAMMPRGGPRGTQQTCGWVRFFAATPAALESDTRRAGAAALLAHLAGEENGRGLAVQRHLLLQGGLPACSLALEGDAEVRAALDRWSGDAAILQRQAALSRAKDTLAPWLAEWSRAGAADLRAMLAARLPPEAAMARLAAHWSAMKAAHG